MFRIAICDDQIEDLAKIVNLTTEYFSERNIDLELKAFAHPDKLLLACEKDIFQIYLLDIIMPMFNGIKLGQFIRRIDGSAQIIFQTAEPTFALDAYLANPINYLIKPIDKTKLFKTFDLAISRIDLETHNITIKTVEGVRLVPLQTIVCVECTARRATYSLISGEKIVSKSIQDSFSKQIEPLLNYKYFIQPHKAFVVNMKMITGFSKDKFNLIGNMIAPISGKQYSAVRDIYMNFILEGEAK